VGEVRKKGGGRRSEKRVGREVRESRVRAVVCYTYTPLLFISFSPSPSFFLSFLPPLYYYREFTPPQNPRKPGIILNGPSAKEYAIAFG
jgi:hypothetical protein